MCDNHIELKVPRWPRKETRHNFLRNSAHVAILKRTSVTTILHTITSWSEESQIGKKSYIQKNGMTSHNETENNVITFKCQSINSSSREL